MNDNDVVTLQVMEILSKIKTYYKIKELIDDVQHIRRGLFGDLFCEGVS